MIKILPRREFIKTAAAGTASILLGQTLSGCKTSGPITKRNISRKPNIVYVFADQWRAQATGYSGNTQVKTPNLDKLASQSVNFTNAVSGCPVCCPYRASLLTGTYPITNGVFLNDATLNNDNVSIAQACKAQGYKTAYIGKWHLDGHGRGNPIPKERRQGFDYWKAFECNHAYNYSYYFDENNVKHKWPGYDAISQTADAAQYITDNADSPFVLFLSWGPPHAPYLVAPKKYRDLYNPADIELRPNVPSQLPDFYDLGPKYHKQKPGRQDPTRIKAAKKNTAGYYAHISALDDCIAKLQDTIRQCGLEQDTIFVFTSDHGDMLYSHAMEKKQSPWDESIRVPFLLKYPALLGNSGKKIDMPINTPDIMPTLLGLSDVEIPSTVEGSDFSKVVTSQNKPDNDYALINCPSPFDQWERKLGGREYRGLRGRRYTYVRSLDGPWLLYDNLNDPYQMENLCGLKKYSALQKKLDRILNKKLDDLGDEFLPGQHYIDKWGYTVDELGAIPYTN